MEDNLVFDTYKYIGQCIDFNVESCVCFSNVNEAIKFVAKHLNGRGFVRPKFNTTKKVYKNLQEYEKEIEEQEIEVGM